MTRPRIPLPARSVLLAATFLPALSFAQEADELPSPAGEAAAEGQPFSRVTDDQETIYAIQRKAYLSEGTWELSLLYNNLIGDRFVATDNGVAVAASVGYHFDEAFSVEVFGGYFFPTESEATQELLAQLRLETEFAKLTQLRWAAGAGVQWSPIYGKLQLADSALGNFAFYLGVGAAIGQTRTQCRANSLLDPSQPTLRCASPPAENPTAVVYSPDVTQVMGVLTAGFRFQFSSLVALRAEVRDYIFTSRVVQYDSPDNFNTAITTDSVRNNIYFQVGISVLLGGESN